MQYRTLHGCECARAWPINKGAKGHYVPFDGTKATSIGQFEDSATSSNILAVPAPTTPTLTLGVPAALRTKNQISPSFDADQYIERERKDVEEKDGKKFNNLILTPYFLKTYGIAQSTSKEKLQDNF